MTQQIKSTDSIAGIPTMEVRHLLRRIIASHRDALDLEHLHEILPMDEQSANALTEELVLQGYLEPRNSGTYKITERGRKLAAASAAGRINRRTADAALVELLKRAEQYNSDPKKIKTIKVIVVFGSFLGKADRLGDLDVAVKYQDRNLNDPGRAETALEYARNSGRGFSRFVDELCWADNELCQILKAKQRTISIQDWNSFVSIAAKEPERVPYRVVFGSPDEVELDIALRSEQGKA